MNNKEHKLPVNIEQYIAQLNDNTLPLNIRQNYRDILEAISSAINTSVAKFDRQQLEKTPGQKGKIRAIHGF